VFDAPDEEYLCTDLSIGNSVLQQVESSKYLGDYLNSNLSWPQHIDYICNKIINLFFYYFLQDTKYINVRYSENYLLCFCPLIWFVE